MPFFSVIIVTYNRADTLGKAVMSIFAQEYDKKQYELIVVDDGSTDGTEHLIEELKAESPVQFGYYREKHKNPAAARNAGIAKAQGRIICFLDSDCTAPPGWLTTIARVYEQHPDTDAVGGWWVNSAPDKPFIRELWKILFYEGDMREEGYVECLATRNLSYRKRVFETYGNFDEELGYPEDRDLNTRLTSAGGKIYFYPGLLVTHAHPFGLLTFYKREFWVGRASYRLYLRWGNLFMEGYRLPRGLRDTFVFWAGPPLRAWQILKGYGIRPGNIFCYPFLLLKYFVHKAGIYYEIGNLRKTGEESKWKKR